MKHVLLPVFLMVSACASGVGPQRPQAADPSRSARAPVDTSRSEAPDLGVLANADIPSGRCGMILYTQRASKPVAIFRSTDDGLASVTVDGIERQFELVGRGGESREGIPSHQYFRTLATDRRPPLSVAVQTSWGDPFPSGAYVREGTITTTGPDGWSRVMPVAGIAGCKR